MEKNLVKILKFWPKVENKIGLKTISVLFSANIKQSARDFNENVSKMQYLTLETQNIFTMGRFSQKTAR
jgi:hypothetical protein